MTPPIASTILQMRAKTPGAPLTSSAGQSVMINSVDSYHIRLAVSGTSCDKYPGESPFSLNQEKLRKVGMPSIIVYALLQSSLWFIGTRRSCRA